MKQTITGKIEWRGVDKSVNWKPGPTAKRILINVL